MGKLTQEDIKLFAKSYKEQTSEKEVKQMIDEVTKSDKKVRRWFNITEIVLTYLALGLIWYNYGFGLSICIWMLSVSQVIGILKAEGKGNAISRLYRRENNVTVESIIEEHSDKWQSK